MNTSSNQNEWVEIFVTENNLNLVNYELVDANVSSDSPSEYNGGITFKNVSFWTNIPRGTIIVIYLKDVNNSLLDFDLSDGKIILEANDENYFQKECVNCDIGNWENEAFIIDDEAELFSIRNNNTNIHSLGHTTNDEGFFNNNWGGLLLTTLSNNELISVIPGDALLNYFPGFDQNSDFIVKNNFSTLGAANRQSFGTPTNNNFIDEFRIPPWSGLPTLTITEVGNQYNLKWNKVSGTTEADNYYTFLVLLTVGNITSNDLPKNGTNYIVDYVIGKSRILAKINQNSAGNINVNPSLNCGSDYTISVIFGRFKDLASNHNQFSSNGIAYNTTNYPTGIIKRESVDVFQIVTPNNERVFCVQDDTTLTLKTDINLPNNHKFTWYKDGLIVKSGGNFGENQTLDIIESGNYFVQLSNQDGCFRNSPLLNIQINVKPKVVLKHNNRIITKDTTLTICKDEELEITSETLNGAIEWYKFNNNIFTKISNNGLISVTENGTYVSIASNGDCLDTSKYISVNILDFSFNLDKDEIDFFKLLNIDNTQKIELTNNSDRVLTFNQNDISIEAPFNLANVSFPIILQIGQSIEIDILLDSDNFEERDYQLTFKNGCNTQEDVVLKPQRINDEVIIEPREIEFGEMINCQTVDRDTLINIFNNTEFDLEIDAVIGLPFTITNTLPVTISKQEELDLNISFNSNIPDDYSRTITIYYTKDNKKDSIKIPVNISIFEPKLVVSPKDIDLGVLSECVDFKDTTIKLVNNNPIAININEQFSNSVSFFNLPIVINPKDSIEVGIRISTLNTGNFSFNPSFQYLPCTLSEEINISGVKTSIDYIFDDETIDFDTIYSCNKELTKTISSRLRIESDNPLYTYIDSISVPNHFQTDLKLNKELFNSNNFSVTFTPMNYGYYEDYIYLRYYPCGKLDSILLKGSYSNISFDVPDTIIFKTVKVNELSETSITYSNNSFTDYSISITDPSNNKFTNNFSNDIAISKLDNEVVLDFSYLSPVASKDTSIITISTFSPCIIEKEVVLIAESVPKDLVDIKLKLPESQSFDANEIIEMNLEIVSDIYDLDTIEINDFSFDLNFNVFVLDLISISGYDPTKLNADFLKENNKLKITLEELDETTLNINLRPLVGNDVSTDFVIDNISYQSPTNLSVLVDSLQITLEGICDLEERLFKVSQSDNLSIFQDKLNAVEIEIDVTNKENLILSIYDLKGEEIYSFKPENIELGKQIFNFDNLNSGAYLVKFQNGLVKNQSKFIIQK